MSHNISFSEQTNKYCFFSVKEKAWHGLGQIVQDYPTSSEALHFAGLDYRVEKRPLLTNDETGKALNIPGYFATVRNDNNNILGVVGKDYQIVQNIDAFGFFDSIVEDAGIKYETAGALGKGERIFITAKLPSYIKVGKDDLIEQYLFLTTSHDGYGSITAAFTPVRIVCNNTLQAALRNHSSCIKIRHTAGVKEKLNQAHKLMGITNTLSAALENIFNRWSTVRITDPELKKLIQLAMVPNKEVLKDIQTGRGDDLSTCFRNICDTAFEYAMTNPSQLLETTKGTLFGAYNAVTGYFNNVREFKNDEARLKSILFGNAQFKSGRAFTLCNDFYNGNPLIPLQ